MDFEFYLLFLENIYLYTYFFLYLLNVNVLTLIVASWLEYKMNLSKVWHSLKIMLGSVFIHHLCIYFHELICPLLLFLSDTIIKVLDQGYVSFEKWIMRPVCFGLPQLSSLGVFFSGKFWRLIPMNCKNLFKYKYMHINLHTDILVTLCYFNFWVFLFLN